MPNWEDIRRMADELSVESDTDILLFNSGIERDRDRHAITALLGRKKRKNILLLLITEGGDPDAAYRIARCLQEKYKKFTLLVSGYCKSAGTLLALGAHELVFAENGELGPLDVQMAKKDELWEQESGLTITAGMTAIREEALLTFEHFFLSIMAHSGGRITVFTASEIAAKLTQGLFSPITEQMDPIHVGEAWRSMAIGKEYGLRLMTNSRNFDTESLERLVSKYPSHGFVIDRREAEKLFRRVRPCNIGEQKLVNELGDLAEVPEDVPVVQYLSKEPREQYVDQTPQADKSSESAGRTNPEGSSAEAQRDVPPEHAATAGPD